jgi:hypothetical protein
MVRQIILGILFFLVSCNPSKDKKDQLETVDTSQLTTINKTSNDITTDIFNIETIVPSFLQDTSFHKIAGLQVRTGVQKIYYYSIYKMPKTSVLSVYNKMPKIVLLTKSNGQKVFTQLTKIDNNRFFGQRYEQDEDNKISQDFFYKFKQLKEFEIFEYNSPSYFQQIIFDKSSDTVYHRVRDVIF